MSRIGDKQLKTVEKRERSGRIPSIKVHRGVYMNAHVREVRGCMGGERGRDTRTEKETEREKGCKKGYKKGYK